MLPSDCNKTSAAPHAWPASGVWQRPLPALLSCFLIYVRLLNHGGVSEAWTNVEVCSHDWQRTVSTGLCLICECVWVGVGSRGDNKF